MTPWNQILICLFWATAGCAQNVAQQSETAQQDSQQDSAARPEMRHGSANNRLPMGIEVPTICSKSHLPQKNLKRARITLETYQGKKRLNVELCLTNRQRQIGMMCRQEMGDDEGMLFIFNNMSRRSFWMKNTLIPLDMIFLDNEGRIVGIVESATPLSLEGRSPKAHAQYVLEIAGGQSKRLGIKIGQWVDLSELESRPPKQSP